MMISSQVAVADVLLRDVTVVGIGVVETEVVCVVDLREEIFSRGATFSQELRVELPWDLCPDRMITR
jgi:hypothetical protein